MELSLRLKTICNCVDKKYKLLVDVGTDHAYIPLYLYKKGTIDSAIATDISKGSIRKATLNIVKYKCNNSIETRCGNGLETILKTETPDLIIAAGMGGMLVIDILNGNTDVVKNAKKIIVQPQRDIDKVRNFIHNINLKIIDEKIIYEDKKYYNIIVCEHGFDDKYSNEDYLFGKILINQKNAVLKEYIRHEMYKIDKALKFIRENNNNKSLDRLVELEEKNKIYKKVFECL